MNYIQRCERAINQLVDEEFKRVSAFVRDELQPPTEEQLAKMIADRAIKDMRKTEEMAGICTNPA